MGGAKQYQVAVPWTGNEGSATNSYRSYERSHTIHVFGKPVINGSADPLFRGDPDKHNPEELLYSFSICSLVSPVILMICDVGSFSFFISRAISIFPSFIPSSFPFSLASLASFAAISTVFCTL